MVLAMLAVRRSLYEPSHVILLMAAERPEDLLFVRGEKEQILRFAQDDVPSYSERSERRTVRAVQRQHPTASASALLH